MRKLFALMLAALLFALPGALAEAPEEIFSQPFEDEAQIALDVEIDPQAAPAKEAGDTGLSVEPDDGSLELGEIDLPVGDMDGAGDAPAPDGDLWTAVLSDAAAGDYVAIADGARVYADAALEREIAAFPEGAAAYVESVEASGAVLKIRYDTAYARSWAMELPSGYVSAAETLRFSPSEADALASALGADRRARAVNGVPVPVAVLSAEADAASEEGQGLAVAQRTQAQIQAFADEHPAYGAQINIYSVAAKDEPYSVGRLSPVNQQSALNLLNQMRYIAGLDANLALMPEQETMEAAAALVLRLYGGLSHYPPRAKALEDSSYDSLYSLGYTGAGRSNIAMGYAVNAAILAYMADADDENAEEVGHRRWILNPTMGKTVTGANGWFSAMYAHDQSAPGGQTRVAWPAQQMPVQYFSKDDPWSVSFGRELDASQIEVDLVRQWDGRRWHFSEGDSDGLFAVDNRAFGQRGCVIFRPDGLDGVFIGDDFNVSITDGASGEITRYTVHFFNLDLTAATPLGRPEVTAVKTDKGNRIGWNAVERATGYYVCRRTADALYAVVADVTGETSYLDTDVDSDETYYYQVYAHTASVTCPLMSGVEARAPQPEKIKLNKSGTVTLYTNQTLQLKLTMTPSYAQTGLFWYSTNERVAVVDDYGLVKPLKKGTATIYVVTDNNKTKKVKLKVTAPPKPTKVTLNKSGTVKLKLGKTLKLKATLSPKKADSTLKWSSSDKKVVKVSSKGKLTARKEGTATITVKTANGKKASVKVKVVDPTKPTKVKLNKKKSVSLRVGKTLKLKATLSPSTARSKLKWSSSDKKVAKVSSKGVVTAVKPGTATITVKTANGKKASVKVKVKKK